MRIFSIQGFQIIDGSIVCTNMVLTFWIRPNIKIITIMTILDKVETEPALVSCGQKADLADISSCLKRLSASPLSVCKAEYSWVNMRSEKRRDLLVALALYLGWRNFNSYCLIRVENLLGIHLFFFLWCKKFTFSEDT